MRRPLAPRPALRGFTLLEVMIGITLLVLIVLPLASLYAVSLTTIQQAALYSQGLSLARERMDLLQLLDYDALDYDNLALVPGFEAYNRPGGYAGYRTAFCCQRDDPSTTNTVEESYDPTDTDGEGYPVPIYRDYYNNYTGQLLDPNFNGLCDDDLNGDGIVDQLDINICNPNGEIWNTSGNFPWLDGQPRPGDGLFDTVIEGLYADSYDPLYGIRTALRGSIGPEIVSPITDESLKYDFRRYDLARGGTIAVPGGIPDYEHRNRTYDLFVRMTSIIDPTPRVGNPINPDTLVDQRYIGERINSDGWGTMQVVKLVACLKRDLPLYDGANTLTIGPHRRTANPVVLESQWRQTTGFNKPATPPRQGKKVIVRVLWLSGESDGVDLNNDGLPDGMSFATARQVVLERLINDPNRYALGNNFITGVESPIRGFVAPPVKFSQNVYQAIGEVMPDVIGDDEDSDFCSEQNDGLPYLAPLYFPNQ